MIYRKILVLGATGMLGQTVTSCLMRRGHRVRMLTRDVIKARRIFGKDVDVVGGSAIDPEAIQAALRDCQSVHISLPQESELIAARCILDLPHIEKLERITYVSATSACEENRWFEVVNVKMQVEQMIRQSGLAHTIFRPTWAMETLNNFIRSGRVVIIVGKKPPPIHFFAASEFGRIVAASYDNERALGRALYVHGPKGISLPDALKRLAAAHQPALKTFRMKLWQAQLLANAVRHLTYVTRLIAFFDQIGELGDPTETNNLFGAPRITLEEWINMPVGGSSRS